MTSRTVDAADSAKPVGLGLPSDAALSRTTRPGFSRSTWMVPMASLAGVVMALGLVIAWFPKTWEMWNLPIQAIDAPSHYYFIRKLLRDGLSVAFELNPNDSFYPPLFHLLVCGLIKVAGLFGISVNIFTGLNLVWIITSGLVFPAGMLLWCSYFFSDLPRPQVAGMCLTVPILSVTSAAFPFWFFDAGPLFAYGLATSLLPFSLYAGLRLIDAIADRGKRDRGDRGLSFRVPVNLVLVILILLAHPRIAFTYVVLMVFFILFRLSWKFIACTAGCGCLAAALFAAYVMYRDHGKNYLHPSTWFHTFQPTRSLPGALGVLFAGNLSGPAGLIMAVCVCLALAASLLLSGRRFREGLSLVLSFLLVGVIYVCSAAVSGPLANILTAAWYRGETRPLAMLPLAIIPLLVFGARCLLDPHPVRWRRAEEAQPTDESAVASDDSGEANLVAGWSSGLVRDRPSRVLGVAALSLALVVAGNVSNPIRVDLARQAEANAVLDRDDPHAQLTRAKFRVLTTIRDRVGQDDAVIISDPMNGSMYGMTLYGLNMLYPVYNPMDTKNGKVFGEVELSFDSGDSDRLLATVCPVDPSYTRHGPGGAGRAPKYFLTMGPQAPDLQMFTYKAQYDPFHKQELIDGYVRSGAMQKVEDFGTPAGDGEPWALYRFACR